MEQVTYIHKWRQDWEPRVLIVSPVSSDGTASPKCLEALGYRRTQGGERTEESEERGEVRAEEGESREERESVSFQLYQ